MPADRARSATFRAGKPSKRNLQPGTQMGSKVLKRILLARCSGAEGLLRIPQVLRNSRRRAAVDTSCYQLRHDYARRDRVLQTCISLEDLSQPRQGVHPQPHRKSAALCLPA
jgi:hypothetical protein